MKTDAKFFLINVSSSQKELHHLMDKFGELKSKQQLKDYATKVMDEYARNFHRPGVESHRDLLWFAKLEHYRYYSFQDKEVKSGEVKRELQSLGTSGTYRSLSVANHKIQFKNSIQV